MKREEIENRVSSYADLFLESKKNYADTCKKYQVKKEEMNTLFTDILSVSDYKKYVLLCHKYTALKELEEEKILRKTLW